MFLLASWAVPIIIFLKIVNSHDLDHDNFTQKINQETEIPSPTQAPSPTVTEAPSSNPTLTPIPTPTDSPITPTPVQITSAPTSPPANDIPLMLLKEINDFRSGKNLSALATDGFTCSFAVMRAGEITGNFNHDGFKNRIDSKTLPYPSYSSVAENIAMNSNPNEVVRGWINSPGHNENLSKDVPYACVGKNGNYYVFEAWRP